jgi:tetratricopeptide (TPR) repeat protein
VAAVFALHPLHVESVAWVTERKDVLAGLFWMLGLYVYAHYTKAPSSKARYLSVLLCLILGLMSKSTLVTFPAVLLLLDIWPLDRLRSVKSRVLLEKIPMFALVVIAGSVTLLSQRAAGHMALGAKIGFGSRLANAIESYWHYLLDAVWPAGLAALYPHPYLFAPVSDRAALTAAGLGIGLIASTGVILMASRRRPYLGVGWLWYLGTLVPMIGLVQFGFQARADRYMYLPLVGLSIVLAWGIGDLVAANRRNLSAALAGVALIALTIVTRMQIGHWEHSIALFERAVAVTERNFYAHERLAYELLEAERFEAARDHYLAAIAIAPWYGPFYYSLALTYERAGDDDAAIAAHQKALRVQPNMAPSHGYLGLLLLRTGRPAQAKRHLLVATRAMPDSVEYRDALAAVVSELERSESGDSQP